MRGSIVASLGHRPLSLSTAAASSAARNYRTLGLSCQFSSPARCPNRGSSKSSAPSSRRFSSQASIVSTSPIQDGPSHAIYRGSGCAISGQRPHIFTPRGAHLITSGSRSRFTSSPMGCGSISPKSYATYSYDPARPPPPPPPPASSSPEPPSHPRTAEEAEQKQSSNNFWKKILRQHTPQVYEHLESFARRGYTKPTEAIVRLLLTARRERLNKRLYNALIITNTNPVDGSVGMVRTLLNEMADEKLEPDERICHSILKVLAVHPDHLLRAEVLAFMANRWIPVTQDAYHDIIAGMVREGQLAMALEKLDEMITTARFPVANWLHSLLSHALITAGEIDEAMAQFKFADETMAAAKNEAAVNAFRAINTIPTTEVIHVSNTLWYRLLDGACSAYHYDAISFVWHRKVVPSVINPSTGMCLRVLETAGRAGDAELATDVLRVLGNRRHRFTSLHYEPVIEAYINSGDLFKALAVLGVMAQAGIEPTVDTTRSLFVYLNSDPSLPAKAFDHLVALAGSTSGGKAGLDGAAAAGPATVPIAAVNVILESLAQRGEITEALSYYTRHREVCPTGPNVETFNTLFKGCRISRRQDIALFLVSEMVALKLRPDALTYDRLTLLSIETAGSNTVGYGDDAKAALYADHSMAVEYLELMIQNRLTPRKGTLRRVYVELAEAARQWLEEGDGPANRVFVPAGSSPRSSPPETAKQDESSTESTTSTAPESNLDSPNPSSSSSSSSSGENTSFSPLLTPKPSSTLSSPENNLRRFWALTAALVRKPDGIVTELARLCESSPPEFRHMIPKSVVRHAHYTSQNHEKPLFAGTDDRWTTDGGAGRVPGFDIIDEAEMPVFR